jgi:hypothetical protein
MLRASGTIIIAMLGAASLHAQARPTSTGYDKAGAAAEADPSQGASAGRDGHAQPRPV